MNPHTCNHAEGWKLIRVQSGNAPWARFGVQHIEPLPSIQIYAKYRKMIGYKYLMPRFCTSCHGITHDFYKPKEIESIVNKEDYISDTDILVLENSDLNLNNLLHQ